MPRLPAEAAMLSSPTSFEPPMESPPGPRLADDRPKTMLPKWHPGSQPRSFSLSSGEEPLPLLPPDSVARIGRGQGQVSSRSGRSPRRSDGDQPGRCSKRTAIVAAEAQSPKPGPGDFAGTRLRSWRAASSSGGHSQRLSSLRRRLGPLGGRAGLLTLPSGRFWSLFGRYRPLSRLKNRSAPSPPVRPLLQERKALAGGREPAIDLQRRCGGDAQLVDPSSTGRRPLPVWSLAISKPQRGPGVSI